MSGPLVLAGGGEFLPALEKTDEALLGGLTGPRVVHIVLAAAARQGPERALATARHHFEKLGADVVGLDALTHAQADRDRVAAVARRARFLYVAGGDPGHLLTTLRGSRLWRAMLAAWVDGAVLAGSSAGAMVLGEWCLLREAWPDPVRRRFEPALRLLPDLVVVPHLDEGGGRWLPGVLDQAPPQAVVLGIDGGTAVAWDGRSWQVSGAGTVERFGAGAEQPASAGQAIDLPEPALPR